MYMSIYVYIYAQWWALRTIAQWQEPLRSGDFRQINVLRPQEKSEFGIVKFRFVLRPNTSF